YMKGHAGIVVTGANATTNLSVFSVGRGNAVNQAFFRDDVTYDGLADIAFVAISSADGKFGGLRTANASYFATRGVAGIYAPGVEFGGPVLIGDINAADAATPTLAIGAGADVRIAGGDLFQSNGRAVQVAGLVQLKFTAGGTSHNGALPVQTNKAVLEQNGADVTAQIVAYPAP
ncbi:MAG: serine hydrolase, partial [Opitutaceae bacterium]